MTSFSWTDRVHFLVLDERSERTTQRILSDSNHRQIATWLADSSAGATDLFVLASPVPLSTWVQNGRALRPLEVADDVRDGWASHSEEFQQLLETLVRHFVAHPEDRLLVLSGDIHRSGVNQLKMCERSAQIDADQCASDATTGRVWGYEVISSGIANDRHASTGAVRRNIDRWDNNGLGHFVDNMVLAAAPKGGIEDSPSFAELFIEFSGDEPRASVVFYPSISADGATVANDHRHLRRLGVVPTNDYWSEPQDAMPSSLAWIELSDHVTNSVERRRWVSNTLHSRSVVCISATPALQTTDQWSGAPRPTSNTEPVSAGIEPCRW